MLHEQDTGKITSANETPLINGDSQLDDSSMRRAMINATLSSVFYSMNTIIIKVTQDGNPASFTSYNFGFWRGFSSTIALYYYLKKEDSSFIPFKNIQQRYWLSLRAIGFFVTFMLFIISMNLVRVSIVQVLASISPAITLIAAVIVLKEQFYFRYIAGIVLCFIGSAIIVLNEKGNNEETERDPTSFFIGITICVVNIVLSGYINVSQKVLIDNGMSNKLQVFYVSVSLCCCSTVMCLLTRNFGFNLWIMSGSTLNGVFFFCEITMRRSL